MPKPDADLCMGVNLPLDKKLGNQDWATGSLGLRASGLAGPSGCRAGVSSRAGGRGPSGRRAVAGRGPPGLRAGGPSRAVGRGPLGLRAAGPPGRRGPRASGRQAAGLLLAKPGEQRPQNRVSSSLAGKVRIIGKVSIFRQSK